MGLPPKNLYNKRFENMSIVKIWFTSIQAGNTACNYRTLKRFEYMSILKIWFTSIQAGNTARNYRSHNHFMLSRKTYQNQAICYITMAYRYVTRTFVARNKFAHVIVKVARNTKKVGQASCMQFQIPTFKPKAPTYDVVYKRKKFQ